jgi:GTP-binding protein
MTSATHLRNLAIIAHVDHGKTTLVDKLLRQSGAVRRNQPLAERALDSHDLERERGITILAKCTSVDWQGTRINIVDTPGHADFGGEVERILSMVDGALLLVDAAEGPMPQTKFVLMKALARGLAPIVVVNKADRPDARPHEILNAVFDLFAGLDASEAQLDFPSLFASAKEGWASADPEGPRETMAPLFDMILEHVPPPEGETDEPFAMLVTTLESDPFLGRVLTGRIHAGKARLNMPVKVLSRDGRTLEQARLTKLLAFRGLARVPIEEAEAGDLIAVAGLGKATVADTIAAPEVEAPIPAAPIDPPTLAMTFSINDSPLAGREGDKVTSRMIRDRLWREAEGNVAIRVSEAGGKDSFEVAGRGELQLGVLIETMRREGFELSISRPRVLFTEDPETGERLEPIEELLVDVDDAYSGVVVEKIAQRKGELKVHDYAPYKGAVQGRRTGVLIANSRGPAVAYALWNLEDRGALFIDPGTQVYPGMIIGEHSRGPDLEVNPLKAKQLTNIRAAGKDEAVRLTPPRRMTLEQAIAYIGDDELVEVTPQTVRLRKRTLDPHERKRQSRLRDAG